jgi:hypothetical protein
VTAWGSLGRYQFGKYLFTRAQEAEGSWWDEESDKPAPSTSTYGMYREPNELEASVYAQGYAPAMDVGSMEVWHHPPAVPLEERRIVGNAAAKAERRVNPPTYGAEGTGRFVASKSWHELHSPTDVLAEMHVDKGSRAMTTTMIGMAENAARERTGQSLQPGSSLSPHSQRLVEQMKSAGLVSPSHEYSANQLTFRPAMPVGPMGGIEGLFSDVMHGVESGWEETPHPVPASEVEAGRQTGREIIRQMRPRPDKPVPPAPGAARPRSRQEQSGHVPRSVRSA